MTLAISDQPYRGIITEYAGKRIGVLLELLHTKPKAYNRFLFCIHMIEEMFFNMEAAWGVDDLNTATAAMKVHSEKSYDMMLETVRGVSCSPITVAICGPGTIEPVEVLVQMEKVQRVYLLSYQRGVKYVPLSPLTSQQLAKIEFVQIDLSGGLLDKIALIFATHEKQSKALKAIQTLFSSYETRYESPDIGEPVDVVLSSLVSTQLFLYTVGAVGSLSKHYFKSEFSMIKFEKPCLSQTQEKYIRWLSSFRQVYLADTWKIREIGAKLTPYVKRNILAPAPKQVFPFQKQLDECFSVTRQDEWVCGSVNCGRAYTWTTAFILTSKTLDKKKEATQKAERVSTCSAAAPPSQ